jgi:hypothetical protein
MHPFIYLSAMPFISSLVAAAVCWLCVFALNKSFLLFRSAIMSDLWDEGNSGVRGYLSRSR